MVNEKKNNQIFKEPYSICPMTRKIWTTCSCEECRKRQVITRVRPITLSIPPKIQKKNEVVNSGIFLLDANFFVHIENNDLLHAKTCRKVLEFRSDEIEFGTTNHVVKELRGLQMPEMPSYIKVFTTNVICASVNELKITYRKKQLSLADKSLLQAVDDNDKINGVITYDRDFNHASCRNFLEKQTNRRIFIGTPEQYLEKIGYKW